MCVRVIKRDSKSPCRMARSRSCNSIPARVLLTPDMFLHCNTGANPPFITHRLGFGSDQG